MVFRNFHFFVCSFYLFLGVVLWEIIKREKPWAHIPDAVDIVQRVTLTTDRLTVPKESEFYGLIQKCLYPFSIQRPSFFNIAKDLATLASTQTPSPLNSTNFEHVVSKAFSEKASLTWAEFCEVTQNFLTAVECKMLQYWIPNSQDKLYRSQWFTLVNTLSSILPGFTLLRTILELLAPGWFLGKMTLQEAQQYLISQGKPAFFFHLTSEPGKPKNIVLSYMMDGRVQYHFIQYLFKPTEGGPFLLMDNAKYSSFHEIISLNLAPSKVSPLCLQNIRDLSVLRGSLSLI